MKRISYWVLSTISALVLLFGYHTSLSGPLATKSVTSFEATANPANTSAAPVTPGRSGTPAKAKTTTTHKVSATRTVTGSVAQTQWGPVQIRLDVTNGKITRVGVLQYPQGNGHDAQINSYALPILTRETVNAQNAQIDMVSGATVTSTGYIQSLQSALDQAHL